MPGPSKAAEAIAALLLPPACREEVLGDLHERYCSPARYWLDVLSTAPMVVISRVRRTSDAQVLLAQACVLYLAFFASERPAVATGAALLGIVLEGAYAAAGVRSLWVLSRGPAVGVCLAMLSQSGVTGWECVMAFLAASAVRMLFASVGAPAGFHGVWKNWRKRWTIMNLTMIAFAMLCAFLVGIGIGVIYAPTHPDLAHVFFNSVPFLLLCTAWIVLMIFRKHMPLKK
jgi:hypothetical protein